jgi:hypothetical protein
VQVLLDSGSDGNLVFVSKDKPILLPVLEKAGSTIVYYFEWNLPETKCKARVELNFFNYSDSKRYYSEPDVVEYKVDSKQQYDLILGIKTMIELGIVLDFKAKTITIDEIILPMRNINHLQGARALCALKLINSLAMEPKSTQDADKHATQILDAKYNKADLKVIVKDFCKHLSAD